MLEAWINFKAKQQKAPLERGLLPVKELEGRFVRHDQGRFELLKHR
jgi:hypothetical protein